MKEIPNKRFTEADTVAELLRKCADFAPMQGLSISDIRARNRLMDAVEKPKEGEVIKLEDADFVVAQQLIREVRWTSRGKHLEEFAALFGV